MNTNNLTPVLRTLSDDELSLVSGGNFVLGVIAGVIGNFLYDTIKNPPSGPTGGFAGPIYHLMRLQ
jgi:bacteriocin-like protein